MLPVPAGQKQERKIFEFLPQLLQTTILKAFFNATIEHVYSKPVVERLEGYIGKITDYHDKKIDFYISEPTTERQIRQIQHAITRKQNGKIEDIRFYQDIVNYIKNNGLTTTKEERLFQEKFYSWQPPIDIDAFLNYTNYYWCVSSPEAIVVEDVTDFDNIRGNRYATITVNGLPLELSSGMILLPKNDVNPNYNNRRWIVEGVGRAILFVEDVVGAGGWDTSPWDSARWDTSYDRVSETPDYITMERGCRDQNPWSVTNRWFHKDVIKNFNDQNLIKIRAQRPIIIFERDLELWNFGKRFRGKVDLIVRCKEFYNIINGLHPGYSGYPFDAVGLNCSISDIGYDSVWNNASSGVSGVTVDDGYGGRISIYDGMRILIADSDNPFAKGKIFVVTGIKDTNTIILTVDNTTSVDSSGEPHYGDYVRFIDIHGRSHYIWFNGTEWIEGQNKTGINREPLFQLYDHHENRLDDEIVYNNSDFRGSKIFSYAFDANSPIDPILKKRLQYNKRGEIVFENNLMTETFHYTNSVTNERKDIPHYYYWKIDSPFSHLQEYGNNWHEVPYPSRQYILFRITVKDTLSKYELKYNPLLPIVDRSRFFVKSLVVKVNGTEAELGTHYTLSGKTLEFLNPLEKGDVLEISLLTDDEIEEGEIYDIPINLQNNAKNEDVGLIGYNDLFNHFTTIVANQENFTGDANGSNNYRDTPRDKWKGQEILQHTAPLPLLASFTSDKDDDMVKILLYCRNEYIRFKNKFINRLNQFYRNNTVTSSDPEVWVEEILNSLNVGKNHRFPFHNTGVLNIFDENSRFIPPTPAFLGITPLYEPNIQQDDKLSSVSFILGHDGSYTPVYNDFRDLVILKLEQLIYQSAPTKFKNDYIPPYSHFDVIPGLWRITGYRRNEIRNLLERRFHSWLAENNIDLDESPSETGFFGINYSSVSDIYGNELPGHWRGIYRLYYDTDRPDLRPWEMLGFFIKPSWWDAEYGPPPYTRGNIKLWEDLRDGRIRQGPRQGIDARFARPQLFNHIPVDDYGNLLDPVSIGIVNTIPTTVNASRKYRFGDGSKLETIWMRSESFPFDLAIVMFLTYPARFVGMLHDTKNAETVFRNRNDRTSSQFISTIFNRRILLSELFLHDEKRNVVKKLWPKTNDSEFHNDYLRIYGYLQFVSSYLESKNIDITTFASLIRNTDVNLAYRASGYIDGNVKITSDISGPIPQENVHTVLYESNAFTIATYSAIIVERKDDGYVLYGYDNEKRTFDIYEVIENNNYKIIGVGISDKTIKPWTPHTAYTIGEVVYNKELNAFFKAIRSFVSGERFEPSNWIRISNLEPNYDISARFYNDFGVRTTIPYGKKFQNLQDLVNVIAGYQKYLETQGFVFDEYDYDNQISRNFEWSVKELLAWILTDPEEGEFIALSPLTKKVKFSTNFGYVDDLYATRDGILNKFGDVISQNNLLIIREGDTTIIEPVTPGENEENLIYFCRLRIKSKEHAIVLDNTTIFNDDININLIHSFVERFRISSVKSGNWKGRYEAPGFLIIQNTIYSNYEKLADQIRYIFDIKHANRVDELLKKYAFHDISYQKRNYLDRLLINEISQLRFYQGLIKQKGTIDVINKILKSQYIRNTNNIILYEEWMFFLGHYASYEHSPVLHLSIQSDDMTEDPKLVTFREIPLSAHAIIGSDDPTSALSKIHFYNTSSHTLWTYSSSQWKPVSFSDFTASVATSSDRYVVNYVTLNSDILFHDEKITNDIHIYGENLFNANDFAFGKAIGSYERIVPTAGYVNEDERDRSVYSLNELESAVILSADFVAHGKIVHVANATFFHNVYDKTWNVFEITEFANDPIRLSARPSDNAYEMVIQTGLVINHAVLPNDVIIIRSSNDEIFNGVYSVKSIENNLNIIVSAKPGFTTSIDLSAYRHLHDVKFYVMKSIRFENVDSMKHKLLSSEYANPFLKSNYPKLVFLDDAREQKEIVHGIEPYHAVAIVSSISYPDVFHTIKRKESPHIDNSVFNPILVRDEKGEIKGIFEVFDPIRGILPAVAKTNLDFISFTDPAVYNTGDDTRFKISDKDEWKADYVGKTWWNISRIRYHEYDMNDVDYKRNHWGKIFGGNVEIYEWIESDNPPSSYTGEGTPYLENDTPYTIEERYDSIRNRRTTKYYFWVRGKTTRNDNRLPTSILESILTNPASNGIRWFAVVDRNNLILKNAKTLVNGKYILELSFSTSIRDKKHSDWILGREGDETWIPPDRLWNKMVDSLVGYDVFWKSVPDENLPPFMKYGIAIRPRQSMFVNRREARRNFVHFLNSWFEKIRFNDFFAGINSFDINEPYPKSNHVVPDFTARDALLSLSTVVNGTTVLVENTDELNNFWTLWVLENKDTNQWRLLDIQKYRVLDFVFHADFYDESVDKNFPPSKTVKDIAERNLHLANGLIDVGDIVLVKDNGAGQWEWQRYDGTNFEIVAKQNATIAFSEKLYENDHVYGLSDMDEFMALPLEDMARRLSARDGTRELRIICDILKNLDFRLVNLLFFNMVRYAMTENGNDTTWAVKTSHVIIGSILEMVKKDRIIRPNLFESFVDYLNEIKPYHVKLREIERRFRTENEQLVLNLADFEYGTSAYSHELTRKNDVELIFDRVSCRYDHTPEKLRFRNTATKMKYRIPEDTDIDTIPFKIFYNPHDDRDKWQYLLHVRHIVSSTSTFLDENFYSIEFSANSMIFRLFTRLTDGTIEIARRIHAAERIQLYYDPTNINILGRRYFDTPPPKDVENLVECSFRETIVEGGAYENDIRHFAALKDSISYHFFDPVPSQNFFETHINPPLTPDGIDMDTFKVTYGSNWWNEYIQRYQTVDEFLVTFAELYGFDAGPYDGTSETPSSTSVSANDLYDIIYTGTSASPVDASWPDTSSVFDTILEGNRFLQPYIAERHPQELDRNRLYDTLIFHVTRYDTNTAPKAYSERYRRQLTNGTKLKLTNVPVNRDSLLVFVNGRLMYEDQYVFDYANLEITFTDISGYSTGHTDFIDIRYWSIGGHSRWIGESHARVSEAASGTTKYVLFFENTTETSGKFLYATRNGVEVSAIALSGNLAHVDLVSANSSDVISLYVFDGNHITVPIRLESVYTSVPHTITLPSAIYTSYPILENVLVFRNGYPLCPPHILYKRTTTSSFVLPIDTRNGLIALKIYKNDVLLSSSLYTYSAKSSSIEIDLLTSVSSDSLLKIVAYISGKYDYDISDTSAKLTLLSSPTPTGRLTIFGFRNNDSMRPRFTRIDTIEPRSSDELVTENANAEAIFVFDNTGLNFLNTHHEIEHEKAGWDIFPWDAIPWDEYVEKTYVSYNTNRTDVCIFYGERKEKQPLRERHLIVNTRDAFSEYYDISANEKAKIVENLQPDTSAISLIFNLTVHPALRRQTMTENPSYSPANLLVNTNSEIIRYETFSATATGGILKNVTRGILHTSESIEENLDIRILTADNNTSEFDIGVTANSVSVSRLIFQSISFSASHYPYSEKPVSAYEYLHTTSISGISSVEAKYYFTTSATKIKFFVSPSASKGTLMLSAFSVSANLPNLVVTIFRKDWNNDNVAHTSGDTVYILNRTLRFVN